MAVGCEWRKCCDRLTLGLKRRPHAHGHGRNSPRPEAHTRAIEYPRIVKLTQPSRLKMSSVDKAKDLKKQA